MKIGILTYHNAINYGAVLQAYALQQVLQGMGMDCEIVNYSSPAVDKQYRRKKLSDHAHWKTYVMDILSAHRLDRKKAEFRAFLESHCILSEKVEDVRQNDWDPYDVLIVGSDQVFNPKNTEGDSAYLLDFPCDTQKIAYAASIGDNSFLNLWKEQYQVDYQSLLREFDALSFREEMAAKFVSELLQDSFATVLDPVLLAGTNVWEKFRGDPEEEYIFVYNLGNIPLLAEGVKRISKETGLKVYVVNKDIKGDFILRGFENASSLSPVDFLKMLSGAKYVITDSFHGTAFSILYHKNFTSVVNPQKVNTNSRIVDLLTRVHLEDRIASTSEAFKFDPVLTYCEVDKEITKMQESSAAWLHGVLHSTEGKK